MMDLTLHITLRYMVSTSFSAVSYGAKEIELVIL